MKMKQKFLTIIVLGLMACTQTSAAITTDTDGYYQLGSEADWKEFVTLVKNGTTSANAKLTANITLPTNATNFAATYMIGTSTNKYAGTFDGAGYTVTYNKSSLSEATHGLFRYTNGATIKNLNVVGSLTSSGQYLGSIVGQALGDLTIDNCSSSMTITSTYSSGDACISGMVGVCGDNSTSGTITITNCLFTGKLEAPKGISGIVGYSRSNVTVACSYCLNAGTITYTTDSSIRNIARGSTTPTLTECYYVTKAASATDGTQATLANLLNGMVTLALQGSQTTQYWGQANLNKSNVDALPSLTSDAAKKVVQVQISGMSTKSCVNPGGAVPNAVRFTKTGFKATSSDANSLVAMPSATEFDYASSSLQTTTGMYCIQLTSAGVSTLMLPKDATIPTGISAYKLISTADGKATAEQVTSTIPANTPVVIVGTAGTYKFTFTDSNAPSYTGGTKNESIGIGTTNIYTYTVGVLTGVYNDAGSSSGYNPFAYVPANSYVLQNGKNGLGWYKVSIANKIKITSFRAYLTPSSSEAASDFIDIDFDNAATGISSATRNVEMKENIYYDLSGRCVENPTKGVYIMNGKKIVVK